LQPPEPDALPASNAIVIATSSGIVMSIPSTSVHEDPSNDAGASVSSSSPPQLAKNTMPARRVAESAAGVTPEED
jgi:hypothetical protein